MDPDLSGHTILVVEDEPLIAFQIANCFQRAGAGVAVARSLADARTHLEQGGICAAIVDFGLRDGDSKELCTRLNQEHVPFVLHSGYSHAGLSCPPDAVIPKPTTPDRLVDAIGQLLGRR